MKNVSRKWIVILAFGFLSLIVVGDNLRGEEPAAKDNAAKEPAATKKVKVGDITLVMPSAWKQQTPEIRLRLAQFEIPAVGEDQEAAELSIFSFGAGGTVEQNVARWKGQFLPEKRVVTMEQGKIALGEYVMVDLAGTFKKAIGPRVLRKTEPMPGAKMLVVMINTEKGTYFLKLVGLRTTVEAASADFRKSIGVPEKKPAE